MLSDSDVRGANFNAGVLKGLALFLDFPVTQIRFAEMKLKAKAQEPNDERPS